jgi:nicotinamidase-related amidase
MSTVLLIVDVQKDYFPSGRMELAGMEEAADKAGQLLSYFRDKGWPTVHIRHLSLSPHAAFFLPDTEGSDIHDNVRPLSDDVVVEKHYPNAFRDTRLLDHLNHLGAKELVICGAMSHLCIDATTRAASDLGFKCVVIHDACATRDLTFGSQDIAARHVHGSFMAALGAAYARVMSLTEFLDRP